MPAPPQIMGLDSETTVFRMNPFFSELDNNHSQCQTLKSVVMCVSWGKPLDECVDQSEDPSKHGLSMNAIAGRLASSH